MREHNQAEERTSFQEAGPFDPRIDSRADVAMVYGLHETFEERIRAWGAAGYRLHVMTGVAWGSYQDYVRGQWDGTPHYDDAQTAAGGFKLEHGIAHGHDVFYMMPSRSYTRYLAEKLRRVVDAGALAIHLEEPEFWVRAGYSAGFQREWAEFYGEPWQDPVSSPDARYRCEKLKQHLYTRALAYLFDYLKRYAKEKGLPEFKCYVPTHSLINYAHWRIVSPESRLLTIPDCDGLIGQVWTGTSRTPTVYRGIRAQRTFEAGYCEYAACAAIVRGTDKRLWQLADPIEDNPNYCWEDYRVNWECTVTASLLSPENVRFEIMPWPRRIFMRTYPKFNLRAQPLKPLLAAYLARLEREGQAELHATTKRTFNEFLAFYREHKGEGQKETLGFADMADISDEPRFGDLFAVVASFYRYLANWEDQAEAQKMRDVVARFYHDPTEERELIPSGYATELQVIFNALRDMEWPGDYEWLHGQTGVGLVISDTLMYQRGDPDPSDPDLSSFYGLAMPLTKHGTALTMVQLERVADPGYLDNIRVLLLTYEGMKPLAPEFHEAIARWVKAGNVLLIFGTGDAYDAVREWWNQGGADYVRPQEHLTELLGLGRSPKPGQYPCGQGAVIIEPASPAEIAHHPSGPEVVLSVVKAARGFLGLPWREGNALAFRRGPYVAAAGMDESITADPLVLPGRYVNLFDPRLAIHVNPVIAPDTRWLLYDLACCPRKPWVIAAAGRVSDERAEENSLSFSIAGMANTTCAVRAWLPQKPDKVEIEAGACEEEWDAASQTILLTFSNKPEGISLRISW